MKCLDPKADLTFKRVFGEHLPSAMHSYYNCAMHRPVC